MDHIRGPKKRFPSMRLRFHSEDLSDEPTLWLRALGGRCSSLADYVAGTGPRSGALRQNCKYEEEDQ